MARAFYHMLRRRLHYFFDSEDSVVNFDSRALKTSIEQRLSQIDELKQFIDQKSSYKIRAQKEIYKKRIDSNLKGIYHDLGALKFKDRKSHDDLARRVDHYYEVNPEKVK